MFGLRVLGGNDILLHTVFTGPSDRNTTDVLHAAVVRNDDGLVTVYFEDTAVGDHSFDDFVITVSPCENSAPECDTATPSQASLWSPNGKMVPINVLGVTDPDGDDVAITVTSIQQDEATNAKGSGNTPVDGQGIGTSTAQIRSERAGPGDGRVYEIGFTADDGNGGSCDGSVLVGVPHSGKGKPAVDSIVRFNSDGS